MPRSIETGELRASADEPEPRRAAARAVLAHSDRLPYTHRLGLALGDDRFCLAQLDRRAARAVGALVHENAVHRRRRLEPRSRVEHVAPGHALPLADACAERDDRLAGGDADPNPQLAGRILLVQERDRGEDRKTGAHRPLGVVLVGDGCAEERDNGVADELLDRAPVALEHLAKLRVVRLEQRQHVLGVEVLGAARRADDVHENSRHRPPLLVPHGRRGVDSHHRRATAHAELRDGGILGAALGADRHWLSVWRNGR